MNEMQYALLCKIRTKIPFPEEELSREEHLILDSCQRAKWVYISNIGDIRIYTQGEFAMLIYEQDLDKARKERAKHDEDRRAQDAKAIENKKESRRHDFKVAAFSVVLTLITERVVEFVDFSQISIDIILAALFALLLLMFFSHV